MKMVTATIRSNIAELTLETLVSSVRILLFLIAMEIVWQIVDSYAKIDTVCHIVLVLINAILSIFCTVV